MTSKTQKTTKPQLHLVSPAYPGEDYKYSHEFTEIRTTKCIHCGGKFTYKTGITYTRLLSVNKLIWWHKSHTINDYD